MMMLLFILPLLLCLEIKQGIDQEHELLARDLDVGGIFPGLFFIGLHKDHLIHPQHRIDWRADLVRNIGQKV